MPLRARLSTTQEPTPPMPCDFGNPFGEGCKPSKEKKSTQAVSFTPRTAACASFKRRKAAAFGWWCDVPQENVQHVKSSGSLRTWRQKASSHLETAIFAVPASSNDSNELWKVRLYHYCQLFASPSLLCLIINRLPAEPQGFYAFTALNQPRESQLQDSQPHSTTSPWYQWRLVPMTSPLSTYPQDPKKWLQIRQKSKAKWNQFKLQRMRRRYLKQYGRISFVPGKVTHRAPW